MKILIVEDAPDSRESLKELILFLGHEAFTAANGEDALAICSSQTFPLIITDVRMPGMNGLELLGQLKASRTSSDSDVIIITGHGDKETAVSALRQGAYDYLDKPINAKELAAVIERCCERRALLEENRVLTQSFQHEVDSATREIQENLKSTRQRLFELECGTRIIAESQAMKAIIAETTVYHHDLSVPVLIQGETGTGKEVIARLVHHGESGGIEQECSLPFIDINCAAISGDLFESELFGYASGAFTGARKDGGKGKLTLAGEGTIFLDEIGEMPLHLQPKLLRVLQERTYYPVGGAKRLTCNARIMAATNQDLTTMVEKGTFRRDLYHRINMGHIIIPPLRSRPEDILALARNFLSKIAARRGKPFSRLAQATEDLLLNYPWPGNVRELENVIERAVLIHNDEVLLPNHLSFLTNAKQTKRTSHALPPVDPWHLALPEQSFNLKEFNQHVIFKALDKFDNHRSRTAQYLGLSRDALRRRLNRDQPK